MKIQAESLEGKYGEVSMRVSVTTDEGLETLKTVSLGDFVRLFDKSLVPVIEEEYSTMTLPKGATKVAQASDDTFRVNVVYEAERRQLVFGKVIYHVPFPRLIFSFDVKKGKAVGKRCFALKPNSNELYRYPFGNVSADGSICFGSIDLGAVTGGHCIDRIVDDFFHGVTNNDYYKAGETISPNFSQQQLLEKLKNMDTFPTEWLMPASGAGKLYC